MQNIKNKNLVIFLFMILATLSFARPSTAVAAGKVTSLLFTCNVSFSAHGESIYIGLGYTHLQGKGVLSCYDLVTGASQHIPLKVTAIGPGVGLGVTGFDISGAATGLKIAKDPQSLLGRYISVRADAAIGVGAAASVPIRVSKDDVSINISVEGLAGIGGGIDFLSVDLEQDGTKTVDPAPTKLATAPVTPTTAALPTAVPPSPATQPQQIVFSQDNQPVQLVDSSGRVLETLYLKSKPNGGNGAASKN